MRPLTLLFVGTAMCVAVPLVAAERPTRTLTVTGAGKATAPPDMATIQTGVVTKASTADEALAANNKAMRNILNILKKQGIEDRDVQTTTHFNVQPIHKRNDKGRTLPEIIAYRVNNQVQAQVRQLDKLGLVLDALVQAGSNQVSGIRFGIAKPEEVQDRARKRAIADARRRAQVYAQAAGVHLGTVQTISENPVHIPQPRRYARSARAKQSAVPIAKGEEEFQVRVQVVFSLKQQGKTARR